MKRVVVTGGDGFIGSHLAEEQYCSRLLRAGASGILTKDSAPDELVEALGRVSHGRKYISPSLAESLTDIPADGSTSLPDVLSDREYEVMVSLASGRRIKQIADNMSLSMKTVSTYHSRILMKLKLENDAQLVRYAIEQGIIQNSLIAREKLIMNELNIRTAPVIRTVKEIWPKEGGNRGYRDISHCYLYCAYFSHPVCVLVL